MSIKRLDWPVKYWIKVYIKGNFLSDYMVIPLSNIFKGNYVFTCRMNFGLIRPFVYTLIWFTNISICISSVHQKKTWSEILSRCIYYCVWLTKEKFYIGDILYLSWLPYYNRSTSPHIFVLWKSSWVFGSSHYYRVWLGVFWSKIVIRLLETSNYVTGTVLTNCSVYKKYKSKK